MVTVMLLLPVPPQITQRAWISIGLHSLPRHRLMFRLPLIDPATHPQTVRDIYVTSLEYPLIVSCWGRRVLGRSGLAFVPNSLTGRRCWSYARRCRSCCPSISHWTT